MPGTVFVTDDDAWADVKVFLTDTEALADAVVYRAMTSVDASFDNCIWHFTDVEGRADKKICYVGSSGRADLTVCFTDSEGLARWKTHSRRNVME